MYSQIETPTSFDRELYSCDIEMTASLVDVEEEMVCVTEKWAPVSQRQEWQDSHPGIKPRRVFRVPKRQLTQRKIQRLQVSTFLHHFFKVQLRTQVRMFLFITVFRHHLKKINSQVFYLLLQQNGIQMENILHVRHYRTRLQWLGFFD